MAADSDRAEAYCALARAGHWAGRFARMSVLPPMQPCGVCTAVMTHFRGEAPGGFRELKSLAGSGGVEPRTTPFTSLLLSAKHLAHRTHSVMTGLMGS